MPFELTELRGGAGSTDYFHKSRWIWQAEPSLTQMSSRVQSTEAFPRKPDANGVMVV